MYYKPNFIVIIHSYTPLLNSNTNFWEVPSVSFWRGYCFLFICFM